VFWTSGLNKSEIIFFLNQNIDQLLSLGLVAKRELYDWATTTGNVFDFMAFVGYIRNWGTSGVAVTYHFIIIIIIFFFFFYLSFVTTKYSAPARLNTWSPFIKWKKFIREITQWYLVNLNSYSEVVAILMSWGQQILLSTVRSILIVSGEISAIS
jgi:hypothetical protein